MGERLKTEGLTPAEVKKQEMGPEYNSGRGGNYRQGFKEAPREGSAVSSGHGRTIAKGEPPRGARQQRQRRTTRQARL